MSAGVRIIGAELAVERGRRKRSISVRRSAPSYVLHADRLRQLAAQIDGQPRDTVDQIRAIRGAGHFKPVLFISHRWEQPSHPDPDGNQLEKLRLLENCYLVYDFSSFPQQKLRDGSNEALAAILHDMNRLLRNVVVIESPGYATRGWCFYEYLMANLTREILCDELSDERFVAVRNAAASEPPPVSSLPGIATREILRGGGSGQNEAQNAIAAALVQSVHDVAPAFGTAQFTVADDRPIVRHLLVEALALALPSKKEYQPYLGEWTGESWTHTEIEAMLDGTANVDRLQTYRRIRLFEPDIPSRLNEASPRNYTVQRSQTWSSDWETREFAEQLGEAAPMLVRVLMAVVAVGASLLLGLGVLAGTVWLLVWRPPGWAAWLAIAAVTVCLLTLLTLLAVVASVQRRSAAGSRS